MTIEWNVPCQLVWKVLQKNIDIEKVLIYLLGMREYTKYMHDHPISTEK